MMLTRERARQSHPERIGPHLSRGDELRVADVVEAAKQLGELVTDGREAFDADWTRQRAAERLLEIPNRFSPVSRAPREVQRQRPRREDVCPTLQG